MLTAAILTHNDEKRIERCLKFLKFCDEIVIIDDNSTDTTRELARKYSVKLTKQPLENDFAAQRNRLLEQATGEWLLFIDPDEEVTTELSNEIKAILKEPKYDVYFLKRVDFFWGRPIKYGELSTASKKGFIRLVKKGSGSWKGKVHEEFVTEKPAGQLYNPLQHYPHETISEFIERVNFYSTIRAQELYKKGKKTSIWSITFFPFGKFIYTYFFKLGFTDGAEGFIYSFMMSFHSFLVRSKLYMLSYNKLRT